MDSKELLDGTLAKLVAANPRLVQLFGDVGAPQTRQRT